MAKRLNWACVVAILGVHALGCGSTSVTQMTAPDIPRCQTTLASVPTLPAAGGRVDVGVVAQRECAWTAASNASWLQVTPTAGQGEAAITLSATANPQGTARNGNITINGSQVAVTQAAAPCTFTLNPVEITMPPQGGTSAVRVTTLTGCQWSASSPALWVVVSPLTTTGSGTVEFALEANTLTVPRSANVSVAGRNVTVTQTAVVRPSPTPAPTPSPRPSPSPSPAPAPAPTPSGPCTFVFDPLTNTARSRGGDETVRVVTGSTCAWTAVSNASWIQIKGEGSGVGSRDLKYEVDRNRTGTGRIGSITIGALAHVVLQPADDGN